MNTIDIQPHAQRIGLNLTDAEKLTLKNITNKVAAAKFWLRKRGCTVIRHERKNNRVQIIVDKKPRGTESALHKRTRARSGAMIEIHCTEFMGYLVKWAVHPTPKKVAA